MDFNGDGFNDLIFGHSNTTVEYYTGDKDGALTYVGTLKDATGKVICGDIFNEAVIVDWNNDGLLDLVLGQRGYSTTPMPVLLFLNQGTKAAYKFSGSVEISLRGITKLFGYHHFDVIDMDKDGKKDLIITGRRLHLTGEKEWCTSFFPNINTDADPKFDKDQIITSEGAVIQGNFGPTVDVCDWNNDGAYDLLEGVSLDNEGGVTIYLGKPQTGIKPVKSGIAGKNGAFTSSFSPDRRSLTVRFDKVYLLNKIHLKLFRIDGKELFSLADISEPAVTIPLTNISRQAIFIVCESGNGLMTSRMVAW